MRRLVIGLIGSVGLIGAACDFDPSTGKPDPDPHVDDSPAFAFEGTGYRTVVPGFSIPGGLERGTRHAFAGKAREGLNAPLDLLREGSEPVSLAARAEPLSVRVSHAVPARATFIDNPGESGVGQLILVDGLTEAEPEKKDVPEGVQVPTDGVWWGQTGDQLLFLSNFSDETHRGNLFWSDTTTSTLIGESVAPYGVVLLADRSAAVAGLDVDPVTGIGRLARIDLATGEAVEFATHVQVIEDRPWRRPNFSLSADGSTVVFIGADGTVRVSPVSEPEATLIAEAGNVPAISTDGSVVAYFDNEVAYAAGPSGVVELGSAASNVYAPPVISEDGQWVFWCESVKLSPGPLGAVAYLAPADGSAPAQAVASNVACDRAAILGDQLTVIGNLSRFALPAYDGFGTLFHGPVGAGEPLEPLGDGVLVDVVRPVSGPGLVFSANQQQGDRLTEMFLATLDTGAARQLRANVLGRSLRVSPSLEHVLFIAEPSAMVDQAMAGELYVSTRIPAGGTMVRYPTTSGNDSPTAFFAAEFGVDSRAVAVAAPDGVVWSFPRPE